MEREGQTDRKLRNIVTVFRTARIGWGICVVAADRDDALAAGDGADAEAACNY